MLTIDITLTMKSPLHIGALSPASTSAIRGLIKDYDGWPYIPASSFKGRLRHSVERLGRGMDVKVCDTHRKMCRDKSQACPACRIFGSAWIPGQVHFVDLQLSAPQELVDLREEDRRLKQHPETSQRYGVGITRTRKVAADRLLYTTELFQPGVPLSFSGTLTNVPGKEEAAWILAGVRLLDSLGGNRSRGLGWIEAKTSVIEADGNLVTLEDLHSTLNAYLEGGS